MNRACVAKRRKRSLEGLIAVNGVRLSWRLLSEPQWTSDHGFKGLCISVRTADARHRELILEYPIPNKQIPQRPRFSVRTIEDGIRQAIVAGWEPESRGRAFILKVSCISEAPSW
jgi:hypothetical protein